MQGIRVQNEPIAALGVVKLTEFQMGVRPL